MLLTTRTVVVGPTCFRTSLAACCGVIGGAPALALAFWAALLLASAGMTRWVTVFWLLSHPQALPPLRMMSLSLMLCGTASRKCRGSEYQIRMVCDPVSSEA